MVICEADLLHPHSPFQKECPMWDLPREISCCEGLGLAVPASARLDGYREIAVVSSAQAAWPEAMQSERALLPALPWQPM